MKRILNKYKKYKKDYKNFILLIAKDDYFYTFQNDLKILSLLFNKQSIENYIKFKKDKLKIVVKKNFDAGINTCIISKSKCTEYYTNKPSNYEKIKSQAKKYYKGKENTHEWD